LLEETISEVVEWPKHDDVVYDDRDENDLRLGVAVALVDVPMTVHFTRRRSYRCAAAEVEMLDTMAASY